MKEEGRKLETKGTKMETIVSSETKMIKVTNSGGLTSGKLSNTPAHFHLLPGVEK
jgi:hypothetical protein